MVLSNQAWPLFFTYRKRKLDTNEESVGFIGPLRGISVEFQSVIDGKFGGLPSTSSLPEDDNGGRAAGRDADEEGSTRKSVALCGDLDCISLPSKLPSNVSPVLRRLLAISLSSFDPPEEPLGDRLGLLIRQKENNFRIVFW